MFIDWIHLGEEEFVDTLYASVVVHMEFLRFPLRSPECEKEKKENWARALVILYLRLPAVSSSGKY